MVNVKNLFGMAVMATALVGCSSNDNLAPDGKDNVGKTGEAYASFTINLPTTSGTRTVDPKTGTEFDGGTAAEYEVKNGTILIFDNSGNFVESVELGTMNPWTDVKKDGVTTAAIATVKLNKVSVGGNYQALVLLNNDVDATTKKVTLPTATTDTYENWSKDISKVNADNYAKTTDGIFMANAPMYTGKTTEPTTLVKIKKVCASPEEAQATAATVVCVERGLAKVTMNDFTKSGYSISGGTYDGATVKIEKWQLDVTNKYTYPVHQIGGLSSATTGFADIWSTPRFYDGDNKTFKRVYWGVDPNYDNTDYLTLSNCKNAFNMIENKDVKGNAGSANPQYCLENTFNLDNMMQGQTTRVVFKAVFTPKGFTGTEKTFYKIGNNTAIWTKENLEKQIKTVALTVMGITDETEQGKYKVKLDASTNNISGTAGLHKIKAENIEYTGTGTSQVAAHIDKINEKLGLTETGISTYLNGEAYYIARIKHFNELTPWTAGTPYNGDNNAFLGRYGVLRNNWYDLSVTSISGLGYPDVPEVKPTLPDDENDQYVNVEVKILSWAKRSQQIKL
ncbi:Mfa1 family fimbria major subunit [Prevotella sp.]|uniref:Mfa1 family fimbria major subunit n=1 Tax=Prevotella sp. TaxID=59823 RepID=UPI0025EF4268|nr:Mfa1 family fimbria major subunit [Prevotella sp.]